MNTIVMLASAVLSQQPVLSIDKMQADLIGQRVTLETKRRHTFGGNDNITLKWIEDPGYEKLCDKEIITHVMRLFSTNKDNPKKGISGFVELRYELVDGNWKLTEIIGNSIRQFEND